MSLGRTVYVFFFLCAAAALGRGAAPVSPDGALRLWAAAGCLGFAAAYLSLRPGLLGKGPEGRLAPWAWLLYLPLRLVFVAVSGLDSLLSREEPWHEVGPGLFLGRRLGAGGIPEGVERVVDMTAEFPAPADVRAGFALTVLPTLDGTPPPLAALGELVDELTDESRALYVHCAQGHGRSALVMAALLMARELAGTPEQAEAELRAVRPGVRLNRSQKARLEEWYRERAG